MKYFALASAANSRKRAEAILICVAVTGPTLFGLMLGLQATYARLIDSSRMDRLDVDQRFAISSDPRLPTAMQDQIARIPGGPASVRTTGSEATSRIRPDNDGGRRYAPANDL